jgi:hypothetical protein
MRARAVVCFLALLLLIWGADAYRINENYTATYGDKLVAMFELQGADELVIAPFYLGAATTVGSYRTPLDGDENYVILILKDVSWVIE